jgi:TDG/mug DNA glycosylase family protein
MPRLDGLNAFIPANPRILILGSFPGTESLEKHEYYAKSSNRFWKLIGEVFGVGDLLTGNYNSKLAALNQPRIALWDVVASCERHGSLDSQIRNPVWNDIPQLLQEYGGVEKIILNGAKAAGLFTKATKTWPNWNPNSLQIAQCLSTSPANQRYGPWERLIEDWRPYLLR